MIHFEFSSVIDAPVETVFAFHEQPEALPKLVPPGSGVSLESRTPAGAGIAAGTRVVLKLPLGLRWVALHTQYERNRLFVDVQQSGPFHSWEHHHIFQPENNGAKCRLTDSVRCSLHPYGLFDFALAWPLKIQLRSMFRHRHAVTAKECVLPSKFNDPRTH